MVTLEGKIPEDKVQKVKVAVVVKDGELMMCDEWVCEWEERTEGGRQKGRISYTPQEWTLCVLVPAWQSMNFLQLNLLSIRSGTCVPLEHHGSIEFSQFHTLLYLLLGLVVGQGSSDCGHHSHGRV